MITEQAKKLKEFHDKAYSAGDRASGPADALFQEIVNNCAPTEGEFIGLVTNTTFTAGMLWAIYKKLFPTEQ